MTKLKTILEAFDSVSDKEAKTPFSKLKDKDIDNDGDTDKADSYLHKKMGTVALKTEQSTYDTITFSVDDDKLDRLLHDKFGDYLDYTEDDFLDSYYTMPRRQFDRFIDAADSRGFDTDELIQMNEMSTTAGAPGYETPFAFGAADDETMEQGGYKKVKTKNNESAYKQMMNQLHEMRYSEYKNDSTATPKTKVNKSISEVNRLLGEIEKIVHRNMRLKTEMGVSSGDYWKNTSKNFGKISERLVRINNKLRELSQ